MSIRRESRVAKVLEAKQTVGWAVLACLCAWGAIAPDARAQTYVGGQSASVQVDLSVLDQLGPSPTLPKLLMPGVRASGRELTPPRRMGTDPTTRPPSAVRPAEPRSAARTTDLRPPRTTDTRTARAPREAPAPRLKPPAQREYMPEPPKPKAKPGTIPKATATQPETDVAAPKPPPVPKPRQVEPVDRADVPELPVARAEPAPRPQMPMMALTPPAPPPPEPAPEAAEVAPVPPPPRVEPPAMPSPAPQQRGRAVDIQHLAALAAQSSPPPAQPSAPPPASAMSSRDDKVTLTFADGQNKLADDAKGEIKALASRMVHHPDIKVQLMAYAAGDDASASKARRMSLSRALTVRSFLMEQEISSSRIEVRALGHKAKEGPADRVDIVITQR